MSKGHLPTPGKGEKMLLLKNSISKVSVKYGLDAIVLDYFISVCYKRTVCCCTSTCILKENEGTPDASPDLRLGSQCSPDFIIYTGDQRKNRSRQWSSRGQKLSNISPPSPRTQPASALRTLGSPFALLLKKSCERPCSDAPNFAMDQC